MEKHQPTDAAAVSDADIGVDQPMRHILPDRIVSSTHAGQSIITASRPQGHCKRADGKRGDIRDFITVLSPEQKAAADRIKHEEASKKRSEGDTYHQRTWISLLLLFRIFIAVRAQGNQNHSCPNPPQHSPD